MRGPNLWQLCTSATTKKATPFVRRAHTNAIIFTALLLISRPHTRILDQQQTHSRSTMGARRRGVPRRSCRAPSGQVQMMGGNFLERIREINSRNIDTYSRSIPRFWLYRFDIPPYPPIPLPSPFGPTLMARSSFGAVRLAAARPLLHCSTVAYINITLCEANPCARSYDLIVGSGLFLIFVVLHTSLQICYPNAGCRIVSQARCPTVHARRVLLLDARKKGSPLSCQRLFS